MRSIAPPDEQITSPPPVARVATTLQSSHDSNDGEDLVNWLNHMLD